MSISKSWYQQDSKSKRVTFVAKLPNKWLFDFGHHLFLEEGSQVPKLFQQPCFHCTILGICRIFCNLLRSTSTLEHVNRVEKMHYTIPRLQVQTSPVNGQNTGKKNLPKLDTMDGRFPFFVVKLHKVIL